MKVHVLPIVLELISAGLLFACFPSCPSEPASSTSTVAEACSPRVTVEASGYMELGDGQVMEILSKHLNNFQSSSGANDNDSDDDDDDDDDDDEEGKSSSYSKRSIVLYREAIEHCAKLYRVMVSNF